MIQRSFTEQIAVITGASSGIGRALALELGAQGATLCLVGRKQETLKLVAESVQGQGPRARLYSADLARDKDIQALVGGLQQDFGRVDILIHSAGVIALGPIECTSVEDLDWQYKVNVRAPYALTQAVLPMLRPHQGEIVFMNSSVGLTARAGIGQYAATKHALKAITDSLRDEVNPDGVRVLNVFLGRTATPMQVAVHESEGKTYKGEYLIQPEDVAMMVINALRLPRTAEVTDIRIRPLKKLN